MATFQLGDKVKDSITGFTGIVFSRTEYLHGCVRISVQPESLTKEGKIADLAHFDEPQLLLVKANKVPQGPQFTGGPRPDPAQRSAPPRR